MRINSLKLEEVPSTVSMIILSSVCWRIEYLIRQISQRHRRLKNVLNFVRSFVRSSSWLKESFPAV